MQESVCLQYCLAFFLCSLIAYMVGNRLLSVVDKVMRKRRTRKVIITDLEARECERGEKVIEQHLSSRKIVLVGSEKAIFDYISNRLERIYVEGFARIRVFKESTGNIDIDSDFCRKFMNLSYVESNPVKIEHELFDVPSRSGFIRNTLFYLHDADKFISNGETRGSCIKRVNNCDLEAIGFWVVLTCSDESVIQQNPEIFSNFEVIKL